MLVRAKSLKYDQDVFFSQKESSKKYPFKEKPSLANQSTRLKLRLIHPASPTSWMKSASYFLLNNSQNKTGLWYAVPSQFYKKIADAHIQSWEYVKEIPSKTVYTIRNTPEKLLTALVFYLNTAKSVEHGANASHQFFMSNSGSTLVHFAESFFEWNKTFRFDRASAVFVTHAQATKVYLNHVGAKMDVVRNPSVGKGMGITQSVLSTIVMENLIAYLNINLGLSNGLAASLSAMIVTGATLPLSKIKTEFISHDLLHSTEGLAASKLRMEIITSIDKSKIFRGAQFVMLRNVLFASANEVLMMNSLRSISKLINMQDDSTAVKALSLLLAGPIAGVASLASKGVSRFSDLAVKHQDKSFAEIYKIIENEAPNYSNTVRIGRQLGSMVGKGPEMESLFKVLASSNKGFYQTARLMAAISFCRFLFLDKETLFKIVNKD